METDNFLTVICICEELSISISFSQFSSFFFRIFQKALSIVYPCITLILLLSDLLLLGYIMVFNVVERAVLLISTA